MNTTVQMKLNIPLYLCMIVVGLYGYGSFKEKKCRKFQDEAGNMILGKTINLIHMCPVDSAKCVNSAVLYKLEQMELINTDLKDLGCR